MKKIGEKLNSINPDTTYVLLKELINFLNKLTIFKKNIKLRYQNKNDDMNKLNLDEEFL